MTGAGETQAWLRHFLARHAPEGDLDEEVLLREQRGLSPERSLCLRHSPEVARLCFGIEGLETLEAAYYFWDTTSLSLKRPLLEYVREGSSALEVGPGPAATLSLFLARHRRDLRQLCAEIDPRFLATAREAVRRSGRAIEVIASDLFSAVAGHFDVVFMNPPYVPAATLDSMGIARESGEGQAGYAGDDGLDVVRRFVQEVPRVLAPGGRVLLGVNTAHVADEALAAVFEGSPLQLERRYWSAAEALPEGVHSQVYVLAAA